MALSTVLTTKVGRSPTAEIDRKEQIMKRLLTATALATLMAGGAVAQTESETQTIERFLPGTDVSSLSSEQVGTLLNIAYSSDSFSERRAAMRAYVTGGDPNAPATVGLSSAERASIENVDNTLDVDTLSEEQQLEALAIANSSGSVSERRQQLQALALQGEPTAPSAPLSATELSEVQTVEPGFAAGSLSSAQRDELRAVLSTGDREQLRDYLRGIQG